MGCGASAPMNPSAVSETTSLPAMRASLAVATAGPADRERLATMITRKEHLLETSKAVPKPEACSATHILKLNEYIEQLSTARRMASAVGAFGGEPATKINKLLSAFAALVASKESMAAALAGATAALPTMELGELRSVIAEQLAPALAEAKANHAGKTQEATALRARVEEVEKWIHSKLEMREAGERGVALSRAETGLPELRAIVKRISDAETEAVTSRSASEKEVSLLRARLTPLLPMLSAKEELVAAAKPKPSASSSVASLAKAAEAMRRARDSAEAADAFGGREAAELADRLGATEALASSKASLSSALAAASPAMWLQHVHDMYMWLHVHGHDMCMYMYMCMCMCMCMCMHMYMHMYMHVVTCTCTCTCVWLHVHAHVHAHAHVCMWLHAHAHAHTCSCTCVWLHVHAHVHAHAHMHMCACGYMHMHMHIHVHAHVHVTCGYAE